MKGTAGATSKRRSSKEADLLFDQLKQIAEGLGQTFAPFCEVVVHDLRDPKNSIVAIHNNLSAREVGGPSTEIGLARITDPDYPSIIANYGNFFADGRRVKSTTIGLKDATGAYIATLCLNVDLTLFNNLQSMVGQFASIDTRHKIDESLNPAGAEAIRDRIDQYAARFATTPRSLKADERRGLVRELKQAGCMEIRRAADIVAAHLGVSRATVYSDAR